LGTLLRFSGLIDSLNRAIGHWVIWLVLGSTVISAVNAVVRKLFNVSLSSCRRCARVRSRPMPVV